MFEPDNAFSGFAVDDIKKAKDFYKNTLGMNVLDGEMGTLRLLIGHSSTVIVYPRPNHKPAEYTILNFPVSNIDEAVDELKKRGVNFQKYNEGSIRTDEKGIMRGNGPDIAWFTDPAGNIMSVIASEPL